MNMGNVVSIPFQTGKIYEGNVDRIQTPWEISEWVQGSRANDQGSTIYPIGTRITMINPILIKAGEECTTTMENSYNIAIHLVEVLDHSKPILRDTGWRGSPYTFIAPDKTVAMYLIVKKIGDSAITPSEILNAKPSVYIKP